MFRRVIWQVGARHIKTALLNSLLFASNDDKFVVRGEGS